MPCAGWYDYLFAYKGQCRVHAAETNPATFNLEISYELKGAGSQAGARVRDDVT